MLNNKVLEGLNKFLEGCKEEIKNKEIVGRDFYVPESVVDVDQDNIEEYSDELNQLYSETDDVAIFFKEYNQEKSKFVLAVTVSVF